MKLNKDLAFEEATFTKQEKFHNWLMKRLITLVIDELGEGAASAVVESDSISTFRISIKTNRPNEQPS